uniref:Uncharacterized protein n=1 Tax=Eutreptiella gymnastica TaxID=73025 RepID=A0A7S4GAA2_9EUGL
MKWMQARGLGGRQNTVQTMECQCDCHCCTYVKEGWNHPDGSSPVLTLFHGPILHPFVLVATSCWLFVKNLLPGSLKSMPQLKFVPVTLQGTGCKATTQSSSVTLP